MGFAEWYMTNAIPRPGGRGVEFARSGKAIKAGIWGIPFLVFYFISLALLAVLLASQPFLCLLCLPLLLIVAIIPALAMTAGLWLCWNVLLSLWPPTGLRLGYEIGRFRLLPEEGWKLAKHLLGRQLALDLTSSSPHIMIIGGSQTGKSATIKTILTRLMEKPKYPALEALRQSAIPLLAVLALLFLLFLYPVLALTPVMLVVYFLQSGHMTQTGVYAGFGVIGIVIFAIVGVLGWHVKGRYNSITAAMRQNTRNVILDFHGEYGFLVDNGFAVIDAREYNPLAPNYEGEQFEHIVSDFVDAFLVAFETAGEVQLAILKKNLEQKRELRAALSAIVAYANNTRSYTEKDRLTGLYLRLEKLAVYNGGKTIQQLTKGSQNVVFDLSGIRDHDAADFFAENILSRYMALLTDKPGGINIVIDEAHRLNTWFLGERGRETTTMRIARESGKFGGRLIVASQNLGDFPPGFAANFGNVLCFRTPAGAELQVLEQMSGISRGLLQSTISGLHKGEALLIGPHEHFSVIKVTLPKAFPAPVHKPEPDLELAKESAAPAKMPVHISRTEVILELLKKEGALTATEISNRTEYPKPAVWRRLQTLTKTHKVIRYEELETPQGMEIFYEINDPNRNESRFHQLLVAKAQEAFAGKATIMGGPSNPDLVLNRNIAIEVETGTKPVLDGFMVQLMKRFEQGYTRAIVIVINQHQKVRYEKMLAGMPGITIATFSELGNVLP